MPSRPPRSWRGLLVPAAIAFAILIGLGVWKVERKAWKEGLIAALTEPLAQPPVALPSPAAWKDLDPASDEYRRVRFSAEFGHGKETLVYAEHPHSGRMFPAPAIGCSRRPGWPTAKS